MRCRRHETAVIAALLHDTLDDTATTPEALSAAFGPAVTAMVVKVSKLSAVNQMLRRDKRKVCLFGVRDAVCVVLVLWRRLTAVPPLLLLPRHAGRRAARPILLAGAVAAPQAHDV